MSELPTSVRAVVGLAATFVDRVRKLPQEAPELPVQLVSGAMQLSLRMQQELAALIARGDEVLGQMHATPDDPPAWATFDDPPPAPADDLADEVDAEADLLIIVDDEPEPEPEPGAAEPAAPVAKKTPAKKAPAKKAPAKKSPAKKAAPKRAPRKATPISDTEIAVEESLVRAMPVDAGSAFDRASDSGSEE